MSLSSRGWQGHRFLRGKQIFLPRDEQWSVRIPHVPHSAHADLPVLVKTGTNETNSVRDVAALRIRYGVDGNEVAGAW